MITTLFAIFIFICFILSLPIIGILFILILILGTDGAPIDFSEHNNNYSCDDAMPDCHDVGAYRSVHPYGYNPFTGGWSADED